jgi:REP element-mobilizing transposase RayT
MSRLRRPFLSDRFFFLTVKLLPRRTDLVERDFAGLARFLDTVRSRQGFFLTAWVFLPNHWHAILFLPYPLTISEAMKSVKLASTNVLDRLRGEAGELWQRRFFDRALRTVQDYWEKVEYIHLNPVRRGLVAKPEDWTWSSAAEYSGVSAEEQRRRCGLMIDRIRLPAEVKTRI